VQKQSSSADCGMLLQGIVSNVTFNGEVLSHWSMYPLNFSLLFSYLDDPHLRYRCALDLHNILWI